MEPLKFSERGKPDFNIFLNCSSFVTHRNCLQQRNESKQLAFRPGPFEAPVISREEVIEIGDSPSPKREEKEVKKKLGKERCTVRSPHFLRQ